jgi:GR25 family glycosyltransferase involved in LPS biosynthesis
MMFELDVTKKFGVLAEWFLTIPTDAKNIVSGWLRKSKKSAIEEILSLKHLRAWLDFLESKDQVLCVLEDDARFVDDADQRLTRILYFLSSSNLQRFIVSLSASYSLKELWIENDVLRADDLVIEFKNGAVNTTVGYLIDRQAASLFIEAVYKNPKKLRLNADFLLNDLLLDFKESVRCMQSIHPVIINGSVNGDFPSSIAG